MNSSVDTYGRGIVSGRAIVLDTARLVDALGYDLIGIQDHPYEPGHIDTVTLAAYVLAVTENVRVFPDVLNLALRAAPLVAKTAASLDRLSGGRFDLGLGAGGVPDGIAAMGGPAPGAIDPPEFLAEGAELVRMFWNGQSSITWDGRYHHVAGLRPGPPPAHPIGVWLGGHRSHMLDVIGRTVDGWVCPLDRYLPPAQAARKNGRIDAAAQQAGRRPAAIRRSTTSTGG